MSAEVVLVRAGSSGCESVLNRPIRYLIRFVYVDSHSKLRSKAHYVTAARPDFAIDKVRRVYGVVKVLKIEKS